VIRQRHLLCRLATALLIGLWTAPAAAALVTTSRTMTVDVVAASAAGVAAPGDQLLLTVTYDDAALTGAGVEDVRLGQGSTPGSGLTIDGLGLMLDATDEVFFAAGFPVALFVDGRFAGVDFLAEGSSLAPFSAFEVAANRFSIRDLTSRVVIRGSVDAVAPVPAAAVLLATALGLGVVLRRRAMR
jgi:hypothetical protein